MLEATESSIDASTQCAADQQDDLAASAEGLNLSQALTVKLFGRSERMDVRYKPAGHAG
jgi:hypothetical protein